jgi:hypothetical protein
MGRTILGIVLAALAVFFWGFVYRGLSPLPYTSWKHTNGDEAAQAALLEHFPENGTYHVLSPTHDETTLTQLYTKGPVAFVHVTSQPGRPLHDMSPMIKGLLLYILVAAALTPLLGLIPLSLDGIRNQIKISGLMGLVAALLIDLGDVVWWYLSLEWKLHTGIYHMTSWMIMTVVLCQFILPKRNA